MTGERSINVCECRQRLKCSEFCCLLHNICLNINHGGRGGGGGCPSGAECDVGLGTVATGALMLMMRLMTVGGGIGGGIVRRTAIKETVGHALGDLEMHDSENGI